MGKLTHLEAFTSDDAKRGREWREPGGHASYKREGHLLLKKEDGDATWLTYSKQVAAMEGTVRWADEPKTLTPGNYIMRLKQDGSFDVQYGDGAWGDAREFGSVIEQLRPSQPAEPPLEHNGYCDKAGAYPRSHPCVKCQSDYLKREQASVMSSRGLSNAVDEQPAEHAKPPLKVGDRVRRKWPSFSTGRVIAIDFSKGDEAIQVQWDDGVGTYPNDSGLVLVEAEPQVEFPLTYGEAIAAAVGGAVVSAAARPECRYWYSRGFRYRSPSTKTVAVYDGWDADDEEMCCGKWRIVPKEYSNV